MYKRFLLVLLSIISLTCAGCFKGNTDLSIDESGAVHSKITFSGIEFMMAELENRKQELLKEHPNAVVTPVQDGGMSGFSITMDYEDMDSFAKDRWEFFATRPGLCKGIQKKSRWFFDAYSFDIFVEGRGKETIQQDKEAAAMAEAFFSQIRLDFTLNLPYEADSQNADTVSNSNKALSWNLASSLLKGENKKINVTFKLWNKLHIWLTIGIAVMLAVVIIIFAMQATTTEGNEKRTKIGFSLGAGGMLLILALLSAYLLLAPIKYTDNDIISGTVQPEINTTQSNQPANAPTPKPTQPSSQQNRQSPMQPPTQQNRPSNSSTVQNTPEQKTPSQILQTFHQNITNKNYWDAYNCLSKEYQDSMSYEKWASGFHTTVSSTVSDIQVLSTTNNQVVLTYTLKAVDNPGGTQYFKGTAVLIKAANSWKIDDITNKTL